MYKDLVDKIVVLHNKRVKGIDINTPETSQVLIEAALVIEEMDDMIDFWVKQADKFRRDAELHKKRWNNNEI